MNDNVVISTEEWAEYIRLYRGIKGMTQAEFGALIGCTRRCVSEWEAQKTFPQKNKQTKLFEVLGPVLPELSRELMLKKRILQNDNGQVTHIFLEKALTEYSAIEPERCDLILKMNDLKDRDIQLVREIVDRLSGE